MSRLQRLHAEQGQSPWLDNLTRADLNSGRLARLVADGIRGVTANRTIVARAIESSEEYDEQLASLLSAGRSTGEAYWELVAWDVSAACAVLRPVHDDADGTDGFVSVEVDPDLAGGTVGTIRAARALHQRIDEPNLMVKTHSVASFFVSRVDTEVDQRLAAHGGASGAALRGRAAVAQAKLAYQVFMERHSGSRWERLARLGAHPQLPLWAATTPKDRGRRDTYYVEELIGPRTITTLAEHTIEQFEDHGVVSRSVDTGVEEARDVVGRLTGHGIDLDEVGLVLEQQGVEKFRRSSEGVLEMLDAKRPELDRT